MSILIFKKIEPSPFTKYIFAAQLEKNCVISLGDDRVLIDKWCRNNVGDELYVRFLTIWAFTKEQHLLMFMLQWNGHDGPITEEDAKQTIYG